MDKGLLARLSVPVDVEYGTTIRELAKRVGVRPAGLHYRRCKGAVGTHYVRSEGRVNYIERRHRGSKWGQNGVDLGLLWGRFCALLRAFLSPKNHPNPKSIINLRQKYRPKKRANFSFPPSPPPKTRQISKRTQNPPPIATSSPFPPPVHPSKRRQHTPQAPLTLPL